MTVDSPRSFRGLAAAPGRAVGLAHVISEAGDVMQVEPGAILVARILHPHLAPLFFRIGGVVVEEGSLLQHATTLAREHRLPAVVGLKDATKLLREGDRVEVSGDTGEVTVLEPVEA